MTPFARNCPNAAELRDARESFEMPLPDVRRLFDCHPHQPYQYNARWQRYTAFRGDRVQFYTTVIRVSFGMFVTVTGGKVNSALISTKLY